MMQDHYETLGLGPEASQIEVKAAYRSLVRRLHPDLRSGGEGGATDRLLEVQRAYEILSHPRRRASYDAGLPEGMESMLGEGGVADTLADVLTVGPQTTVVEPWTRARQRSDTWERPRTRDRSAPPAPEASTHAAPELPTPSGDGTFLTAIGLSVVLAGVGGALAMSAVAGVGGVVDLLTFLLMTLLAPVLALLTSWALSYTDGRLEDILRRGAVRLRAVREGLRPGGAGRPAGGEPLRVLRVLVLLAAGGVYTMAGAAPAPLGLAVIAGVAFALLHRVAMDTARRRVLMGANLLVALAGIVLAGAAWHGSDLAAVAAGVATAGGNTAAAELIRRVTGVVGSFLVTVVLYVTADLWHDLADRMARGGRSGWPAAAGRRVFRLAGRVVGPLAGVMALLLEGLAAFVRTCSLPGTLIRRAVGGGWL